jgi:hypothetical protein
MRLDALLRAHGFMRVERPPELWEADTDDALLLPLLGEMIAAGLATGASLGDLTLNASNIVVEPFDDDSCPQVPATGEYVALTVSGPTDFGPDASWSSGSRGASGILMRLRERLVTAGARYAYVRHFPTEGSFTVFFCRATGGTPRGEV